MFKMSNKMSDFNFTIRPTQLTSVFGPGAIYDNEEDSLVIMGLDSWESNILNGIFIFSMNG